MVGWMGVVVQLSVLSLATAPFDVHYLVATAIAVETAILHNFLWHERWTWADRGLTTGVTRGALFRLARFNLTSGIISITGNVTLMSLYVGELGLPILLGNICAIASCSLINFLASDRLVFVHFRGDCPSRG